MSEIKKQSTIKDMLMATIEEHIDRQNAKGLKKYGETLDDCSVDDYSWPNMVIEELIDALQYQQKEIGRLSALLNVKDEEVTRLKAPTSEEVLTFHPPLEIRELDVSQIKELIKALQDMEQYIYSPNLQDKPDFSNLKPEPEQSPKEALDNAVDEYKAISERDEIIEDLRDENNGLRQEIEHLRDTHSSLTGDHKALFDEYKIIQSLLIRAWGED